MKATESRAESAIWRSLFRELERRDSPLQMWLLLDQLIAEREKSLGGESGASAWFPHSCTFAPETGRHRPIRVFIDMNEEQGKKLIAYVKELARQHNELEKRVAQLEHTVAWIDPIMKKSIIVGRESVV
jgi:hypothetical protein